MADSSDELYQETDGLINNTIPTFIIGNDNCQFNTIVRILKPETQTNFDKKLIDIAIDLNISGGTISHWRRGITFGNLSNDVLLYELLKEFRSKYASEATLINFIDALYKKDLFQEADNLGKHFGIDLEHDSKFVQSRKNKDNLAKLACGASLFITIAIIGITCLIPFLRTGKNDIVGCPIPLMNTDELNYTVYTWGKSIEVDNCSGIHNILSKCGLSNKTSDILSDSIDIAYNGNLENFRSVLKFVREIFSPSYQFIGCSALQTAMQGNGHNHTKEMLKLVYFIKTKIQNESIGTSLYRKYTDLTERVPENIRLIIFRQCVLIRNAFYNEFLRLDHVVSSSVWENVVYSEPIKDLSKSSSSFWFFEIDEKNDELSFQIRNFYFIGNPSICPSSKTISRCQKNDECPADDPLAMKWIIHPKIPFLQ